MNHHETVLSEMLGASILRFNEIVNEARDSEEAATYVRTQYPDLKSGRPTSYSVGDVKYSPQQFIAMLNRFVRSIEVLFVNPLERKGSDASHVISQLQGTIIALEKERQRNIT